MTHKLSVSRWLIAGAISLCAGTSAFAAGLHSGKYEQLMLAVTPEHQVEGFYSEERGEGNFSCAFYLQGKPEALSTWVDEVYPGSVKASADGVTLKVEQGQQHPGCMNVLMPEIATGLNLTQTASKNWIGLVTVSADKALPTRPCCRKPRMPRPPRGLTSSRTMSSAYWPSRTVQPRSSTSTPRVAPSPAGSARISTRD